MRLGRGPRLTPGVSLLVVWSVILGVFDLAAEPVLLRELPVNNNDKGEEEKPGPGTEGHSEPNQKHHQPDLDKPIPDA